MYPFNVGNYLTIEYLFEFVFVEKTFCPNIIVFLSFVTALESPVSISTSLSDDHSLWIQWEAPKSLPVTGYVIEWCVVSETLPCHISFTLVQHNCIKTLITGKYQLRIQIAK